MADDTPTELEVTPASSYRETFSEERTVPMPSGAVARLRRVRLNDMLKRGSIPNPLLEPVLNLLGLAPPAELIAARAAEAGGSDGGDDSVAEPTALELAAARAADSAEFVQWIATQAYVEPVVVVRANDGDVLPDGALWAQEIVDDDLDYAFGFALGKLGVQLSKLHRFRDDGRPGVGGADAAPDGGDVRAAPVESPLP